MANAKRGRDPKLTPEVQKIIVDRVAAGVPLKFAAQGAGISERTLMAWLAKGRQGKNGYAALLAAVKKAEADAIARNVGLIQKEGAKTWTAAAWMLERRHPEEFASNRRDVAELRRELAELRRLLDKLQAIRLHDPDPQIPPAGPPGDPGREGGDHGDAAG
jgi:DNA invertase Pin-like site-specific DNA recombinase